MIGFNTPASLDLEKIRKILVLAPHPDDELLGCGGTICVLKEMGKEIHTIFLSVGEKAGNPEIRKMEALKVREELGYDRVEFWTYPDGGLKFYEQDIKEKIKTYAIKQDVDFIFSTAPYDFHEDHRILGSLCIKLHTELPTIKFSFYSVYNDIIGNFNVDVSKYMDRLIKSISMYKNSLKELYGIGDKFISIRKFNGLILRYPRRFYESFILLEDSWEVQDLVVYLLGEFFYLDILRNIRLLENELQKKNEELAHYKKELEDLWHNYNSLMHIKNNMEQELACIKASKFYKIMMKYQKIKDFIMPKGGILRNLYDRLMGNG
ncbi:MAG: PIG-L family deacetylase [Aquificaceae bacterium]|jgi:LmbE family N-acetylglucosaminyl deacetylase|uniref:PIG-L deacetylase family protein n=1 Tax=Hydrogenobacter sp. Uz 6-8 TaxID=3384828 RepID=UPI0030A8FFD0